MNARQPVRPQLPEALTFTLLGALAVVPTLVWLSAQVSSLVTGLQPAGVGYGAATRAIPELVTRPGDPAEAFGAGSAVPGPVAFWTTAILLLIVATAAIVAVAVRAQRWRGRPGLATSRQLAHLSPAAVADQASVLRPDLPAEATRAERIEAAGVALGRHHPSRRPVHGTIENSYVVLAPPRAGKTVRVVAGTVADYPGPAVVTSTRRDIFRLTANHRRDRGPIWVFDADLSSDDDIGAGAIPAEWSPVAGADDPHVAMVRARSLARAAGAGRGVANGDFFASHAEDVLQGYLHAAAIESLTVADVRRWALDPTDRQPVEALRWSPAAASWAADLSARSRAADRQRDGVWGVVQQSLKALNSPGLLARCTPQPGSGFDPAELLSTGGTLYIVGQAETQAVVAPLVAALVEAVVEVARRRAAQDPSGRLSPPLLLALDEVAGIAPLPTLPALVADGGGSGITTLLVLQNRAQARARWGEDEADAIIAACTHRLILGGGGELRELEDLARLVGERDDEVRSHTWQPWGSGGTGSSTSTALRRLPVITPAELQALPKGRGILCSPGARPAEVYLPAWWERPDFHRFGPPSGGSSAGGIA